MATPASDALNSKVQPDHNIITPLRTPKACELCRRRKTKCNGQLPQCQFCKLRSVPCVYRPKTRTRQKLSATARPSSTDESTQSSAQNSDNDCEEAKAAHDHVYSSVSASATHFQVSIDHYYGPSSNFSFLQQINRRFNSLSSKSHDVDHSSNTDDLENGEEGLTRFNYGGIFFGQRTSASGDYGREREPQLQWSDLKVSAIGLSALHGMAPVFLNSFLETTYHLMPFWPKEAFVRLLDTFDSAHCLTKAILLAAMAAGATVTKHHDQAVALFEDARRTSQRFDDVVNLQTVQLSMLLGNYQMILGRPNSAYLLVGHAVRKAQAAGLHRLPPSPPTPRTQERTITYWSLYCLENLAAYCFGRPLALSFTTSSTPLPTNQPMIRTIVSLSRMMTRCSDEIYNRPRSDRSLSKLYRSAHSIRSEVLAFSDLLEEPLRWGTVRSGSDGVEQCLVHCVAQHIILLTFRPFLLFRAMLDSPERQCINSKSGSLDDEKMRLLLDGCRLCVDTARKFIITLVEAGEKNRLIRDMGYNGFHLEGATFIVVYALLLGDSLGEEEGWREKCMEVLEMAVRYQKELEFEYSNWFPLKTASDGIRRMVEMLKRLERTDREGSSSQPASSQEIQVDSTSTSTSQDQYSFQANQQQQHEIPFPQPLPPIQHHQSPYLYQARSPAPLPTHTHQLQQSPPTLVPQMSWGYDSSSPFYVGTLTNLRDDTPDGAGSVNFDFGFDMMDIDFEMFLNRDTPGGSACGAVGE